MSQGGKREQQVAPALRVYLLQGCRLEWAGEPAAQDIAWYHRTSARALFILLLCAPRRTASRSQLASILWPETDEEKALDSLRSALKFVRDVLRCGQGNDLLEAQAGMLTLKGQEHLWLDIDAITELVRQARNAPTPHEALPLWEQTRALLCEDLLVEERSSEWSQYRWIKLRRQELRAARRAMVRALADFYLHSGQPGQAEELLYAHVIRFPTDQDALYRLMKVLIQTESFEEARTYYERCRAALADIEKEPAGHVKALAQACRSRPQKMLAIWKSEQKQPQADRREETALSFSSSMTEGILETTSVPEGNVMDQLRRQFLQQTLDIIGGVASPSHPLLNVDLWTPLSRILNKHKSSSIDDNTLDRLEAILGNYWQLFYSISSSALLGSTLGFLQTLTSLLEYTYPRVMEQRLCAMASKTSLLAGKIALDQQHYLATDQYYKLSLQAAQEADDPTLHAVVLARIASSFIEKNQPERALSFFQEALRLCSPETSAITYVWLALHEAEAWAMMHQELPCLKALEKAENYNGMIVPNDDPYWTGFDSALLYGFKGACYLQLHQQEKAHRTLEDALATPSSSRQRAIFFSDLGTTFVQQKEPEAACTTIEKALDLAASAKSTRVMQRLLKVRRDLDPWSQELFVQNLDERLRAVQHYFSL